jgi:hypothetical protein
MKRNVASQVIGAQLINRTDGTPYTDNFNPPTVRVTRDGGTTTIGSGIVTLEGGSLVGYWSYFPTQSETSGIHLAFHFSHPDIVNTTVQVYTSFPQSADINADPRLDNLDATVSSRASTSQLITVNDNVTSIPTNPLLDDDARLDNLDATISSRSTLTAAQVWSNATRTLTSFGTLVSDIWSNAVRTVTGGTIDTNNDMRGTDGANTIAPDNTKIDELHKLQGLDAANPMTVTPTSRTTGAISQAISGDGETTTTVTRT